MQDGGRPLVVRMFSKDEEQRPYEAKTVSIHKDIQGRGSGVPINTNSTGATRLSTCSNAVLSPGVVAMYPNSFNTSPILFLNAWFGLSARDSHFSSLAAVGRACSGNRSQQNTICATH